MTAALVPVKELAASKSRMFPQLDADQRRTLALAMLRDVLAALADTPSVSRRAVVTPDAQVAELAQAAGAEAIVHAPPGLNVALDAGVRGLGLGPGDDLLIVLGDVAGADGAELEQLFGALANATRPAVALAPSSDGGTSALLRSPHGAIPARFGADSAAEHRKAAEHASASVRECILPSLAADLDDAEDVAKFLASGDARGAHTRAALAEMGWADARPEQAG